MAAQHLRAEAVDVSRFSAELYCHMAAAKLSFIDGSDLLVLAVYRPHVDCDRFIDHISLCLDVLAHKFSNVIVAGDFNIDILNTSVHSKLFINTMTQYGLRPTISNYTREFKNSRTAIDNIFVNFPDSLISCRVVNTALSDHYGQEATIGVAASPPHPLFKFSRKMSLDNINSFRNSLEMVDWLEVLKASSLNDKFNAFFTILKYYFDVCFPVLRSKVHVRHSLAKIRLNEDMLRLRTSLLSMYSITKDLDSSNPLRQKFNTLKKLYRNAVKKSKSDLIGEKIATSSNKAKVLWEVINDHKPSKSSHKFNITLKDSSGYLMSDPLAVANAFSSAFSLCSSNDHQKMTYSGSITKNLLTSQNSLFLYPTCSEEVSRVKHSNKSKPSAGADGI